MSFYIICCFFVIQLIAQKQVCGGRASNERGGDDLLEWYYKQSNIKHVVKRQVDYDYNDNNNDENDDWYVFDRVDEQPQANNEARNFQPWQNNQNQINQNQRPWFNNNNNNNNNNNRPTTTPRPAIPNAGPPRLPPCEENCNARTTSEYNPVCGSNAVTYFNNGRFECARFCGQRINIQNLGRCGPLIPRE